MRHTIGPNQSQWIFMENDEKQLLIKRQGKISGIAALERKKPPGGGGARL